MKAILLFSALGAAFNTFQRCFPPSCLIDANCEDSIHSAYLGTTKCCGGKCVETASLPRRLVGELCDVDVHETCLGSCETGSYCSTVDQRCHALPGVNCPCNTTRGCVDSATSCTFSAASASYNCTLRTTTTYVPLGASCNASALCSAGVCNATGTGVCAYLSPGDPCVVSSSCGPNATCKYNSTALRNECFELCDLNVASCCSSLSDCLPNAKSCDSSNNTCLPLNAIGDPCSFTSECFNKSSNGLCAPFCNSTGCFSNVCQLENQIPAGEPCMYTNQCQNGTCYNSVCVAPGSLALGQPCASVSMCARPGNVCSPNNTGTSVCKTNGTTPIGDRCFFSYSIQECVAGAECYAPDGFSNATCTPMLSPGDACVTGTTQYTHSCNNGTCFSPTIQSPSCSSSFYNCTCGLNRVVLDGKPCVSSMQCQVDSFCDTTTATCKAIIGMDCTTMSQCGYSKYDCGCNRKCYLLNAPTPAAPPTAPTAPTPGRCDVQATAWLTAEPNVSFSPYVFSTSQLQAVAKLVSPLSTASQALAVSYMCCYTCIYNDRFNSYISGGYQVDCGAKTLTRLADSCDDSRAPMGMLNCWTNPVSAAHTNTLGLGVLAVLSVWFF